MPTYKQEMPPPGGFAPIDVSRKIPKRYLHGLITLGALYASTYFGFKLLKYQKAERNRIEREDQECRIALTPFIIAEQERLYLKQLRKNREYEENLMGDVAGWKVGHWFDYPVYHNPRGLWCDPSSCEFYAHVANRDKDLRRKELYKYI
ncbi:unnamed protein product [Schistosoma turkestanicum]|nr:unnamed protein product [Schistosoma turkestanicum]